jgi:hypothetical protein
MQEYRLGLDARPQVIEPADDAVVIFGFRVDLSHSAGSD